MSGPTYRLRRPTGVAGPPVLDEDQRRVVEHPGGPLLVLAGPGTGKTTTLVEAVVDRVERRGASPDSVLALTFSRKAAEQLRDRVTARLGRTVATTPCQTFHSFAYSLVREFGTTAGLGELPGELYDAPLRLLSAAEADVVVAELLHASSETVSWPESLRVAAGTRGFAQEVAAVLARAREVGLDEEGLVAFGREHRIPEFVAAGLFLGDYLANLDSQAATDYPDLIRRAVIEAQAHQTELRARYRHVFVDEYQDTDPGQVALLRAIAGDGADLTVVGDPHQSIYAFRGAEVRGILDFPDQFRGADGAPAEVVALRTTRRFGPRLLAAAQRVAARIPLSGSIGAEAQHAFLRPQPHPAVPDGRAEVLTFDNERAEVEHIADLLRRAHLTDGIDWSDMAVLVRSGRASIPVLRRAMTAAGIPVEVAADETPLVGELAVRPLLEAMRAVVEGAELDPDRAEGLLVSPLAGLDAADLRALARVLRARERESGAPVRASAELLRDAVADPAVLDGLDQPAAERAHALARLLRAGRDRLEAGASVEEVLWELWSGTAWPQRLRRATERGGHAARLAHRDLDAVTALFEQAARVEDRRGHTSVEVFLDTLSAQQIPSDTLADKGVRGAAVRLLTAHRSKGLEWRLVVVAHVQEGGWPDLRRRSTLLRPARIGSPGYGRAEPRPEISARELLAEERRLFYVACTRARERLVVTAVASAEDDGEQPSRFVAELGLDLPERPLRRPPRPLSLTGMVAELRRVAADPESSPGLRAAAVRRLARLGAEEAGGRPLVPAADPATWWGTRAWSRAERSVRPEDAPVRFSASALAGLTECPAKWFLEREAGGQRASSQAQGFGNVVHEIADRVARGELAERSVEDLMGLVDQVWDQLTFRTPWSGGREREEVRKALTRFVTWHQRDGARTVLATERELSAEVTLPGGERVILHGFADRLETDDQGRVVVVDLKTGKYPPSDRELAEDPQLGLYQYAVAAGAVDELTGTSTEPGGAELWQLRKEVRGSLKVQAQAPQRPGEDGLLPVERQLTEAVTRVREERFEARPGRACEHCSFTALCPAVNAGTVLS